MVRFVALCLHLVVVASAAAAPYIPADEAQVLEQLPFRPGDPAMRELRWLHAQLAQRPGNQMLAVSLARRYVELGRVTGDPRYAGYAQAALAAWWDLPAPPRDVLLLRATLRQRVHEFDAALGDLDQALARNPRDAQARLTRATVRQVRGEFAGAQHDCEALQGLTHEAIAVACLAGVQANSGRLRESYGALLDVLARHPASDAGLRCWLWTGAAEMAARAGLTSEAEQHFRTALAADSADQYLLAAYADFLLDRGRAREAAALVQSQTRADGLLLRYALALKAQGSTQVTQAIEELRARFAASRMRGDRVHLREEARFELHLAGNPRHALELAQANWNVQKEPADARILLEAALAMGDVRSVRAMRQWLAQAHLEDVQLARLLAMAHPDT